MGLWLIMMFAGLLGLAFVFYKVWTSVTPGISRVLMSIALASTLISVVGLVMTLRSVQSESTDVFIPRATLDLNVSEQRPVDEITPAPTPSPAVSPTQPQPPENENGAAPIPKYDPNGIPEDPGGATFDEKDFAFFEIETVRILKELDRQLLMNKDPDADPNPKAIYNRWQLYKLDHDLWVSKLRQRTDNKTGPGSTRVRKAVFSIAASLEKMHRIYHNEVVFGDAPNMHYISQLENSIEQNLKILEEEKNLLK